MKDKVEILEEIDKYVITACITLLAAFAVIFSINKNSFFLTYFVSVVSIFFLLITLLLSIWHTYRSFLRSKIFEERQKQWMEESKNLLGELITNTWNTAKAEAKGWYLDHRHEIGGKTQKEIASMLEVDLTTDKHLEKNKLTIENITYALTRKRHACYSAAFGPLNEKYSKFKLIIDKVAQKFRYHFFVIGLGTFFVALSLKLFF